ncbi:MAG: Mov34/MPN/PAD-1 family protein [Nostoc sp.]|uniref:Mov34/MPN/PAD-1 family protein n=1 Tax=Nostoc sp. TaxID=1180 RepID=UPI002FFADA34
MERDPQKENEIQGSMPNVEVPAIKFMQCKNLLYVQMNIKSYVFTPPNKLFLYQGFLFVVDPKRISLPNFGLENDWETSLSRLLELDIPTSSFLPKIRLVGDFPTLFHPHFQFDSMLFGYAKGEWVDYKREDDKDLEKDLGSYILRIARSLKYEEGYINPNANRIGNQRALDRYLNERQSGKFPTDNVQLPSGKTFKITSDADTEVQGSHPTSIPQEQGSPKFQPLAVQQQPQRKPKFEVRESQPPYSPTSSPIEKIQRDVRLIPHLNSDVRDNERFSATHELYVTNAAFDTISHHIGWNKHTNENVVEQGGILLGAAFVDPKTEITYAITSQAIPGKLAKGTSSYLEVTHETWKEMLDDVDRLNTGLQVIGWYHTHPNNLDVFMSGTDRATQSRLFGNSWQFAIVLNPHKRIWRAFYGSNSYECGGYVLSMNPPPSATYEQ